jgi:hypothetical protein
VNNSIDGNEWRRYALMQNLAALDKLAAVVGEQDQRVIDARAAWRKGDVHGMGAIIADIKGA